MRLGAGQSAAVVQGIEQRCTVIIAKGSHIPEAQSVFVVHVLHSCESAAPSPPASPAPLDEPLLLPASLWPPLLLPVPLLLPLEPPLLEPLELPELLPLLEPLSDSEPELDPLPVPVPPDELEHAGMPRAKIAEAARTKVPTSFMHQG